MAQIHKWRVVIIMSHDGESFFEYNDLEQSILDKKKFRNLSCYLLYYNQKYDKISIKMPSMEGNIRSLKDIPETNRFNCRDFYDRNTLISFLQLIKSTDVQKDTIYHYFVITWGHGGGLFYYPLGKFEDLLREFGLSLNPNNKTTQSLKNEVQKNLLAYVQTNGNFSNTDNNSIREKQLPFLSKEMFADTMGFTKEMEDDALGPKLVAFNEYIAKTTKFYTATDLNAIFKEGLGYIDVYFALNCFTQMIDTGFELRHSVNMMVAPQTTMPLSGINYKKVFARLEDDPGITLPALAKVFVDSFQEKYSYQFLDDFKIRYPEFDLTIVSFSCNFLSEYNLLVTCLNELTHFIKKIYNDPGLIDHKEKVSKARKLCGDLTPDDDYGIIDLYNFVVQLHIQFQVAMPDILIEELTTIKQKLECVKKFVLAAIRKPEPDAGIPTSGVEENNPSFLSFFAPAFFEGQTGVWRRLLDVYPLIKNEFSSKSDWVGFVTEFYNKTLKSF